MQAELIINNTKNVTAVVFWNRQPNNEASLKFSVSNIAKGLYGVRATRQDGTLPNENL